MRLLGPLPGDVLETVCEMTGFTREQMRQHNGSIRLKQAKHLACWVSRQFGASWQEIANDYRRDHTTVMNSAAAVEADPSLKALAMEVAEVVRERFGGSPKITTDRTEVEA